MQSTSETRRLTVAQALVAFLAQQYSERDGVEQPFFAGCLGIFGHGNIAGIGQALQQTPPSEGGLRYFQTRNEQASVHIAAGFARMHDRLQAMACTSSIGPGATNMITGAAAATINRIPVLLLPGDIFARRNVAPVLQQLELPTSQDVSVNDCFRPVSRYWDRINRPDQLLTSLPEALRVLTSPSETGCVTLCLPQDVQAEAYDYPVAFFRKRVWHIARTRADKTQIEAAAKWIREAKRPMIVAGGGTIYSGATELLRSFAERHGIPVGETFAGKGSMRFDDKLCLGAVGATGTFAANRVAHDADLVIGVGTRYSDFTTASKTAFQDPAVRFININVTEFDAGKHMALPLVGDARAVLEELDQALGAHATSPEYVAVAHALHDEWEAEVDKVFAVRHTPVPSQGELIGALSKVCGPRDIIVNAAGSMPGDLHKLWRSQNPKAFHLEYGYSCMGYEIAGGIGVKMAAPDRNVFIIVGDGSYLMLSSDLVTAVQENIKVIVIIWDNGGYKSIGSLSRSLGQDGFGTRYVKPKNGMLPCDSAGNDVELVQVDFAANARSLGANVIECSTYEGYVEALEAAKTADKPTVVVIKNDRYVGVAGHGWWDVQVAEVSTVPSVQKARQGWEEHRKTERFFF